MNDKLTVHNHTNHGDEEIKTLIRFAAGLVDVSADVWDIASQGRGRHSRFVTTKYGSRIEARIRLCSFYSEHGSRISWQEDVVWTAAWMSAYILQTEKHHQERKLIARLTGSHEQNKVFRHDRKGASIIAVARLKEWRALHKKTEPSTPTSKQDVTEAKVFYILTRCSDNACVGTFSSLPKAHRWARRQAPKGARMKFGSDSIYHKQDSQWVRIYTIMSATHNPK